MTFREKVMILEKELGKPLPGKDAQYRMAPEFRGKPFSEAKSRDAAVMICLFPGEDDLELVFIKRPDYEGPHGGQVSFPGGVYENTDTDLRDTAIRETREEIGIECPRSAVIGALTPLMIPVSGMKVHPYVAYLEKKPQFRTDAREVDFLIIAGLAELFEPSCIVKEKWKLHGTEMIVPFYRVKGNVIWGATAMMLSEFLVIISRSGLNPRSPYSGNYHSGT
jgi:8-oxo-dGTP pyrophosphatase MutT (NUDIX family)